MAGSARRALKVLEVVAASDRPLGVTEIARRLGLAPGTVFRTLDALQRSAYTARYQASARYVLGAGASRLRQSLFAQFKLRDIALPYLRQLASVCGETVALIVPLGWYGVRVTSARGSNEITNAAPLGPLGPLGQHYAARPILAFAPEEFIARYLAWERSRGFAASAPAATIEELAAIAERGFAFEEMGFAKGRGALALPIRDGAAAIAAIAVEGPVLDLKHPLADARAVEIVRAIEAAVKAHPKEFQNPFGHIDPNTINLDQI